MVERPPRLLLLNATLHDRPSVRGRVARTVIREGKVDHLFSLFTILIELLLVDVVLRELS